MRHFHLSLFLLSKSNTNKCLPPSYLSLFCFFFLFSLSLSQMKDLQLDQLKLLYINFYGGKSKELRTKWDWSQTWKGFKRLHCFLTLFAFFSFSHFFCLSILLKSYYLLYRSELHVWIDFFFPNFLHSFCYFVTLNYKIWG